MFYSVWQSGFDSVIIELLTQAVVSSVIVKNEKQINL